MRCCGVAFRSCRSGTELPLRVGAARLLIAKTPVSPLLESVTLPRPMKRSINTMELFCLSHLRDHIYPYLG